jgi:hypothetical protein
MIGRRLSALAAAVASQISNAMLLCNNDDFMGWVELAQREG